MRHTDAAFPSQRIVKANGCAPVKTGPSSVFELAAGIKGITPPRDSQHVLKAEPARADATDRESHAHTSPVGGPMGAGQTAAAVPAGLRIALWSDGKLEIWRGDDDLMLLSRQEVRQLVAYLDSISLGPIHEDNSHG